MLVITIGYALLSWYFPYAQCWIAISLVSVQVSHCIPSSALSAELTVCEDEQRVEIPYKSRLKT